MLVIPPFRESVDVACHVGTPLTIVRTSPFAPTAVEPIAPVPLPNKTLFARNDVCPVPPYTTPTDVVAETTPPFACSGPLKPDTKFNVPTLATVVDEVWNDE